MQRHMEKSVLKVGTLRKRSWDRGVLCSRESMEVVMARVKWTWKKVVCEVHQRIKNEIDDVGPSSHCKDLGFHLWEIGSHWNIFEQWTFLKKITLIAVLKTVWRGASMTAERWRRRLLQQSSESILVIRASVVGGGAAKWSHSEWFRSIADRIWWQNGHRVWKK